MAKKSDYLPLTKQQKEEIRRLTQLANRRISAAFKAFEAEGKKIVPRDIVGDIQIREKWSSEKYAISRSVKFKTQKEYREQLNFLRSFEKTRSGIKEYTKVLREKTLAAMETSMGSEVPEALAEIVRKMTSPQLGDFWNKFSDKSRRIGMQYSSNATMDDTMVEYFSEDKEGLAAGLAANITTGELIRDKQKRTRKKRA